MSHKGGDNKFNKTELYFSQNTKFRFLIDTKFKQFS